MAESASPPAAPGQEDRVTGSKARLSASSAASGLLAARLPSWRALLYVSAVVLVLEIVVILLGVLWQLLLAGCYALVQLVFPSQQVTWSKILCVLGGIALSVFYCVELRLSQPAPSLPPQRDRNGSASNQSQLPLRSPRKLVVHIPAGLARISPLREDRSLSVDAASTSSTPRSPYAQSSGRATVLEGEFPQLTLIDDGGRLGTSAWSLTHRSWCVNSAHPIAFENEFFQGQFLLMVREQAPASEFAKPTIWNRLFERKPQLLWMQVQGRFKRAPPPGARCFIAMELPSSDFSISYWARQALEAAIAITRLFMPSLHIAFADEELETTPPEDDELPHVAFPLYQAVDEMIVTSFPDGQDKAPVLGQTASFGETPEQKAARQHVPPGQECFTTGSLYSFQFHTKYLDLPNWKLVNLPGLPDLSLDSICGHQPIRMAAYMITAPQDPAVELQPSPHSPFETHARAIKKYLFGFSLHYQKKKSSGVVGSLHVSIPPLLSSRSDSSSNGSPASLSQTSSLRLGSPFVDLRPTATSAQYPYRAEDLDRMKFELAMWVERVDPVAGKRKIAYLLTAEEQLNDTRQPAAVQIRKHVVVRSAATMKTALLLLKDDNADENSVTSPMSPGVFKRLHVESREYLYSQIDQETELVARALQRIAASPTLHGEETYGCSEHLQQRSSTLDQLQKAVLFHCLTSPAKLPCHRSYQEIGVQWPASKRNEMRIIWEQGIYRNLFSSRFLRQEWLTVTETELLFFRSYSVKPCKAILLSDVLRVQGVNNCVPELNGEGGGQDPYSMIERTSTAATNRWFCVQVHLVGEIVSFFVESETVRQQCISSLNELMHHRTCPPTRDIERESTPVRLNQRSLLCMKTQTLSLHDDIASRLPLRSPTTPRSPCETPSMPAPDSPFTCVQQALSQALQVHATHPDQRTPSDLLIVLDAVESINDIDLLDKSQWNDDHDEKHAFLLNLYHLLFIHASLVFGLPRTQSERKKMQTIPFFLLGNRDFPDRQVRVTLDALKNALHLARVSPAFYCTSHWTSTLTCTSNSDNAAPGSSNGSFSSLPGHLVLDHGDYRSHFALQLNCNPAIANVMRVYHSDRLQLSEELNQTCAEYLAHELWIDGQERVIYLPKVCEWYQDDFDADRSVRQSTMTLSSSASTAARYGSWSFVCLQLLLNLMNDEQHDLVQHMLLGAGDESQIRYNCFWTQDTGNNSNASRNTVPTPAPLSVSTRSQSASSFFQSFF